MNNHLKWSEFKKVDIRTGTIVSAKVLEKAKNPAYVLQIDFGPLGIRKSSAQITNLYNPQELIGKQIVAVVNFPPKQIADIMSECLVLGAIGNDHGVVLLETERNTDNGLRIS